MGDVVNVFFDKKFPVEQELKEAIERVLFQEFEGKISVVAAIGVLTLVQHNLMESK